MAVDVVLTSARGIRASDCVGARVGRNCVSLVRDAYELSFLGTVARFSCCRSLRRGAKLLRRPFIREGISEASTEAKNVGLSESVAMTRDFDS